VNSVWKIVLIAVVGLLPLALGSCASEEVTDSLNRPPLRLRVMTYNIHEGGRESAILEWQEHKKTTPADGNDDHFNLIHKIGFEAPAVKWANVYKTLPVDRRSHIVELIRKVGADVVLLQECTGWEENENQILNDVAAELDMHAVIASNHGVANVALLSRYPIAWQRWLGDETVFAHNMLIAGLTLSDEQTLQLVNVHFDWTATPAWSQYDDGDAARMELYQQQCEVFLDELRKHRFTDMVVAGDLNHSPMQKLFDFSPLYRQILDLGYVDMVELHNSHQYHRERTSANGTIVDYIFGSSSLKGACRESRIVKTPRAYEASDHLPLWADLVF
jgi:endonuclease/exonuclease/phosphatase family metal-dependent hydrolase